MASYKNHKVAATTTATLAGFAMMFSVSTLPAQWKVSPGVAVGLEYDDNAFLTADPDLELSVNGYLLEADAEIGYETPTSNFSMLPRVLIRRYDSESALDYEEYYLDFDYRYAGQLSEFKFRGNFADESIRSGERSDVDFDADDPDDVITDDSGRVSSLENRQLVRLGPEWAYRTGERTRIRIGAEYLDINYDEQAVQLNNDFRQSSLDAGIEYAWSERSTFTIGGYVRDNYFQDTDQDYIGYGGTIGFFTDVRENARFVFNIGADVTEDFTGLDQSNPIGELSYIHKLQTSRVIATYRRTVGGSGASVISVRDTVSLNLVRDLSEKFSIGLGARAYQTAALDKDEINFDERDYLQLRALFSWHLTPVFWIDFDYSITNIDREFTPGDARSNHAFLWFRYRSLR